MALNTTDRAACLIRAKERSDNADTTENDAYLGDMLDASVGRDDMDVLHYRPYIVAAQALDTSTMRVEGAPEAEFRSVEENIAALRRIQAAEDARLGLTVPIGWTAETDSGNERQSSVLRNVARY